MTPPRRWLASLSRYARTRPLEATAGAAGLGGLVAAVPVLPAGLRAFLLIGFILAGPGCTLVSWSRQPLRPSFLLAVVPAAGIALWLLVITACVSIPWWQPRIVLVAAAVAVLALTSVAARRRYGVPAGGPS